MFCTIIVIFIVLFDQTTKFLVATHLQDGKIITLIPNVISLCYHENSGAAWGMFADRRWIFMTASIVAIVAIVGALIYMRDKNPSKLLITSLSFFLGGGIGNMIDRFRLKYVIDFLRFDFFEFLIFNIADSFITIGAVSGMPGLLITSSAERIKASV